MSSNHFVNASIMKKFIENLQGVPTKIRLWSEPHLWDIVKNIFSSLKLVQRRILFSVYQFDWNWTLLFDDYTKIKFIKISGVFCVYFHWSDYKIIFALLEKQISLQKSVEAPSFKLTCRSCICESLTFLMASALCQWTLTDFQKQKAFNAFDGTQSVPEKKLFNTV